MALVSITARKKADFLPLAATVCKRSGFNRLCKSWYGGLGIILMFHRFTNDPESRVDCAGTVSGLFLDKLLGHIRKNGPEIISLRNVPQAVAAGRKFVCLTADDGYRDNAEIALPILRRHNAPATIFIPSGILDRSLDSWWLQIEEMAKCQADPRSAYNRMIAESMRNPEALKRLRARFPASGAELNDRHFMSRSEIKAIAGDPLIDIGGHTVSHSLLKKMPEDQAYREIMQNKIDLEELVGRPVEAFAYPFGNPQACGKREYMLARKAGYKVAVTTRDGNVFPRHEKHMTALPRYSIRGQSEHLEIFDMQKSGVYRLLKSGFRSRFVTE
jgi:peptidoglycan/xylan/chitin deacetylase (PgdA/CDA1 family)